MAPPKGYKKGYVKNKDGEWIDPRTLPKTPKKKAEKPQQVIIKKTRKRKKKVKDDLDPPIKSVPDDKNHAKVIVVWRDTRGRERTTCYTMAELNLQENVSEEFSGAKKQTRIHLSLDGSVLEKL